MSSHVAVWLDHREARIFHFQADAADELTVAAPPHNDHHKHTRGQEGLKEHPEDIRRFYRGIATALQGAERLLVVGAGTAHLEFVTFLREFHPELGKKIVGVETVDHPTDAQLVAHAKTYFKGSDRMA